MRYTATFVGRTVGAIGTCYPITTKVEAPDMPAAERALYERYEHIQGLRFVPLEPEAHS